MQDRTKKIRVAALGAGVLALAAAGASAQAPAQAEVYRLATVEGRALPVVIEQEGDCRDELLGGTLTLEADGEWTLVTQEREVCGDRVEEDEEREEGRYTVEGQTVRFLDEDGEAEQEDDRDDETPDFDVDDLTVGTRSAGALSVRLEDGRTAVFRQ